MGYALTIYQICFFAKLCFRIASEYACQADGIVQRLLGRRAKVGGHKHMLYGHRLILSYVRSTKRLCPTRERRGSYYKAHTVLLVTQALCLLHLPDSVVQTSSTTVGPPSRWGSGPPASNATLPL